MNLYLIGMPGCGKSTISRELASKLKLSRIDLDEEIVKAEGMSIEEIFSKHGEEYFRQTERKILESFPAANRMIIATGGGAPCFFDNIDYMNQAGITIYLDVPASTLTERLTGPGQNIRPMVKNKSRAEVQEFVENKLKERIGFYKKATIQISGANIKTSQILDEFSRRNITF
jgi:shikimate kinase